MQTLKYFFKILNYHKVVLVIYVFLFAMLNIFFTEFGTDMTEIFTPQSLNISVINRDDHPISDGLEQYLGDLHNLVPIEDDYTAMQDALFFWDAVYILIIDDGFGAAFYNDPDSVTLTNKKAADAAAGFFVDEQIDSYLLTLRAYLSADFELERALTLTLATSVQEVNVLILETEITGASFYFQVLPFVLVSVIMLALGSVLIVYRKDDLTRRMDVSPTPALRRKTQIMIGCALCALLIWLVFMVGAYFLTPHSLTGTAGLLRILNSLVFTVVCVSLAFLIGQVVKKSIVLQALAQILGLGMSFISGVFMPQEFLADSVLAIARFTPTYWYIRNLSMIDAVSPAINVDMGSFLQNTGIQLGFAIALFAAALAFGRERRAA
ncbi:MAG: ABC transporter permease [Oscillospiraceae bacterium]|nr:ABC transporter permease [Oscillospiraceae bacterium]